jgi:hypothetical protein
MAKIWRTHNEIPWICNSEEEDLMATIGDYVLKVEQLDVGIYWWQVSYQNQQIESTLLDTTGNKEQAIGRAEGLFALHRQRQVTTSQIRFFKSSINEHIQQDSNDNQE